MLFLSTFGKVTIYDEIDIEKIPFDRFLIVKINYMMKTITTLYVLYIVSTKVVRLQLLFVFTLNPDVDT